MVPSGKRLQKTMENHHFQWENPLFLWSFSMAMLVYQGIYDVILGSTRSKMTNRGATRGKSRWQTCDVRLGSAGNMVLQISGKTHIEKPETLVYCYIIYIHCILYIYYIIYIYYFIYIYYIIYILYKIHPILSHFISPFWYGSNLGKIGGLVLKITGPSAVLWGLKSDPHFGSHYITKPIIVRSGHYPLVI